MILQIALIRKYYMGLLNKYTLVLDKKMFCILIIGFFMCSTGATASDTAIIHGAVYEWDTFSPLENVIVEVNSTPSQSMLARYGVYSFNLAQGEYLISASYYSNNTLVYYTEENVTISDNGDYVLDLILLPAYMSGNFNEKEFTELEEIAAFAEEDDEGSYAYIVAFFLVLIVALGAYLYTRNKPSLDEENSDMVEDGNFEVQSTEPESVYAQQLLPDDLQEVIEIIEGSGGRITQRELRTKVKYSEAKVSLMVSDLEDRGLVHKFKKGRGNIIVLADHG